MITKIQDKEECRKQIYNEQPFADGIVPRKYCLGSRRLRQVILPYNIHSIEDWAFAHCRDLRELWLPKKKIKVGQGILDGCNQLSKIIFYELNNGNIRFYEQEGELLACAEKFAPGNEVFDGTEIGTANWYEWLDRQICRYLRTPDDEGFDPFLAGGEEDYEEPENHLDYYMFARKQKKISVLFARFRQENYLSKERQEIYASYLSEQEEALFAVLLEKREQAYESLVLCEKQGVLTLENADRLLRKMVDPCYTESRGYLLHIREMMRQSDIQGKIWKEWDL